MMPGTRDHTHAVAGNGIRPQRQFQLQGRNKLTGVTLNTTPTVQLR